MGNSCCSTTTQRSVVESGHATAGPRSLTAPASAHTDSARQPCTALEKTTKLADGTGSKSTPQRHQHAAPPAASSSSRLLLRPEQLSEAQQRLPTPAKYLAWHLIYDSARHGGLSRSVLYRRCLQCLVDTTGILHTADHGHEPSSRGPDTAPSHAGPSEYEEDNDTDTCGGDGYAPLPTSPTTSTHTRQSASSNRGSSAILRGGGAHRRRRRRCALLLETQCLVLWHPTPLPGSNTSASAAVLCRLGIGLFLDRLPNADGTVVSLKPDGVLAFTFLVPQRPPSLSRPVLRGLPRSGLHVPEPYTELDGAAGEVGTCPQTTWPITNPSQHTQRGGDEVVHRLPSSVIPSPTSSVVSLVDVNVTAVPPTRWSPPVESELSDGTTATTATTATTTTNTTSEDSTFTVYETFAVLQSSYRVGRPLRYCRGPWTRSLRAANAGALTRTAGMGSHLVARPARLTRPALSASPRFVSARHASVTSISVPAFVDESEVHRRYPSADAGLLVDRVVSNISDATLSASFGRHLEGSTYVVVSPTSTARESALTPVGVLTDFSDGPWIRHERVSSQFPTPPSTTTNTQSMGFDGSAGDMYSPFSATNGISPMNDTTADEANDSWPSSLPLHTLRFFPPIAGHSKSREQGLFYTSHRGLDKALQVAAHHTGPTSPPPAPTRHGEAGSLHRFFLLTTADHALSLWSEAKSHRGTTSKKTRKAEAAYLSRLPDFTVSPDLQQVTVDMDAPLFRTRSQETITAKLACSLTRHKGHRRLSETTSRTTLGTPNASHTHGLSDDELGAIATSAGGALPANSSAEDAVTRRLRPLLPEVVDRTGTSQCASGYYSFPSSPWLLPTSNGKASHAATSASLQDPLGRDTAAREPSVPSSTMTTSRSTRSRRSSVTRSSDDGPPYDDDGTLLSDTTRAPTPNPASMPLTMGILRIQLCSVGEW